MAAEPLFLVQYGALRLLGAFFRILPRRAGLALGDLFGRLAYGIAVDRRRLALRNLRTAFCGEMDDREIRRIAAVSFRNLGLNLAEFLQLPGLSREDISRMVTISGRENLEKALEGGKGALILSLHLGNWDMMSTAMVHAGFPISLITKVSRSEAVNRIWMGYREKQGIGILMGRGAMKDSLRWLAKGGAVGFVLDQNARRIEGVFVPFFGRPACTLTSLAILARRTGLPVVPVHTFREGGVHRVIVGDVLEHTSLQDADADIKERTAAYTRWTEEVVRAHPEQWTWLHNRWRTRPLEELEEGGGQ